MRCKACDVLLFDHDDPEMCGKCLDTINPDNDHVELDNEGVTPDCGCGPDSDDFDADADDYN